METFLEYKTMCRETPPGTAGPGAVPRPPL